MVVLKKVLAEIGCPELNRDKVNYKMSLLEAESKLDLNTPTGAVVGDDVSTTNISQLTSPSMLSQLTEDTDSSGRNKGGRPKKTEFVVTAEDIKRRKSLAITKATTDLKKLMKKFDTNNSNRFQHCVTITKLQVSPLS